MSKQDHEEHVNSLGIVRTLLVHSESRLVIPPRHVPEKYSHYVDEIGDLTIIFRKPSIECVYDYPSTLYWEFSGIFSGIGNTEFPFTDMNIRCNVHDHYLYGQIDVVNILADIRPPKSSILRLGLSGELCIERRNRNILGVWMISCSATIHNYGETNRGSDYSTFKYYYGYKI